MDFNIKNILLGTAVILPATMGLSISNADTIQNLTINGSVNFRVAPNVNSTKIDKLKKGQTVEYLGMEEQVIYIKHTLQPYRLLKQVTTHLNT